VLCGNKVDVKVRARIFLNCRTQFIHIVALYDFRSGK
jgi:hypothetical protein